MTTRKNTAKKWTFIVLVVFILIAIIGGTYSRYTNTGSGEGEIEVAQWAFKINDVDLTDEDEFTVTFDDVPNNHVVEDKIAPASQVYAELEIDPDGSEVSVGFDLELGDIVSSTGTVPEGLEVTKVCYWNGSADGDELEEVSTGVYSGTILLNNRAALTDSDAKTVRVYVTWDNEDDAHSGTDTVAGITPPTLSMDIDCTAYQYIEESNP